MNHLIRFSDDDGNPVFINATMVTAVWVDDDGDTNVSVMGEEDGFIVEESAEEVWDAINEHFNPGEES